MTGPYTQETDNPTYCAVCGRRAWGEVDSDTCPECEETEEEEDDDR